MSIRGQVVLISGGGSGIGAAGAAECLRRGAAPVLFDIDGEALEHTRRSLQSVARLAAPASGDILCVQGDVTRLSDCEAAVRATIARHGRIHTVWANAGIASFGTLSHIDPGAFARCLAVNVNGVFNFVRAALPAVRQERGYVAVSASMASFAQAPLMSAYGASKAAVEALCNAWRLELHAHGVEVGAIHASWVLTPMITEGSQHPAFARMRASLPAAFNREMPADLAARLVVDGIAARRRRIWVPGWMRLVFALRSLLHTRPLERASLIAAPEMEAMYLETLASAGAKASSYAPRELQRAEPSQGAPRVEGRLGEASQP